MYALLVHLGVFCHLVVVQCFHILWDDLWIVSGDFVNIETFPRSISTQHHTYLYSFVRSWWHLSLYTISKSLEYLTSQYSAILTKKAQNKNITKNASRMRSVEKTRFANCVDFFFRGIMSFKEVNKNRLQNILIHQPFTELYILCFFFPFQYSLN